MKYAFHFEIFGKEMKTEIEAPNETEAREILMRKVLENVKVISVEGDEPPTPPNKRADEFLDKMFEKLGFNAQRKWQ